MDETIYQVLTPAGSFAVAFGDDENPYTEYLGDTLAISFFKNWLELNQVSGNDGYRIMPDSIDPSDLYGFCQSKEAGIIVIPPFDDLLSYSEENQDIEPVLDSASTQENNTMQTVSGTEKLKLVRELSQIRSGMAELGGLEKVKSIRRIAEIRVIMGVSGAVNSEPEQPTITTNPELDKQKAKLAGLIADQERMKAANKVVNSKKLTDDEKVAQLKEQGISELVAKKMLEPDYAGRVGFPSYMLTNNNATIRNTKARIDELEAKDVAQQMASNGERDTSYDFDGGTIDLNYAIDRLQVFFDSRPDSEMISKLKSNGFKWSPSNTAWQRQLTDNAIYAANRLFGTDIKTAAQAAQDDKENWADKMKQQQQQTTEPTPITDANSIPASAIEKINGIKSVVVEKNPVNEDIPKGWLLLSAPRPLVGTKTFENGDFTHGRFYAALDPNDSFFNMFLEKNLDLDAYVVLVLPSETIDKMVLGTIPSSFMDAYNRADMDTKTQYLKSNRNKLNGKTYKELMILLNNNQEPTPENDQKQALIDELEALKSETDIMTFDRRLDEIAAKVEAAGLMEELDPELNATADVLTELLAEAENS